MSTERSRAARRVVMACVLVAIALPGVASAAGGTARGTAGTGFQPAAASFISPSWGVALGAVGCQDGHACQARLRFTADGGTGWHVMHAPQALVSGPGATIGSVLFATRADGWLYRPAGQAVWYTNDGGARWRRLSLGGTVDAMDASARTAYAVVSTAQGAAAELFASPVGRVAWTRVRAVKVSPFTGLAVLGKSVWVTSDARLFASTDGTHWHQYSLRCPPPQGYTVAGVAAASPSAVAFICLHQPVAGKQLRELLTSNNGGKTAQLAGEPAPLGFFDQLATPPGRPAILLIASAGGATSILYRSANGGRTWSITEFDTGGLPWSSLSYVSANTGWVVLGGIGDAAGYPQLLKTTNAGSTWQSVTF